MPIQPARIDSYKIQAKLAPRNWRVKPASLLLRAFLPDCLNDTSAGEEVLHTGALPQGSV